MSTPGNDSRRRCVYFIDQQRKKQCGKPPASERVSYCDAHYRRIYRADGRNEERGYDIQQQRIAENGFWRNIGGWRVQRRNFLIEDEPKDDEVKP